MSLVGGYKSNSGVVLTVVAGAAHRREVHSGVMPEGDDALILSKYEVRTFKELCSEGPSHPVH